MSLRVGDASTFSIVRFGLPSGLVFSALAGVVLGAAFLLDFASEVVGAPLAFPSFRETGLRVWRAGAMPRGPKFPGYFISPSFFLTD